MMRLAITAISIAFVAGCEYVIAPPNGGKPVTAAVFNAEGAPTVQINLPDMMCEDGCALTVRDILSRQPGAKAVRVDFEGKIATVAIDERTFDSNQAIADLVDKGFDHSKLAQDAPSAKPQTADASN